jgi:hypothetical protein
MLASFLVLGSFLVLAKAFGRDVAELQSRIVERFVESPTLSLEEQSKSEISEQVDSIPSVEAESISLFSSIGIIILIIIALSFSLLGIILIRFRRDIFEEFYT